jgi:hypothetical protein
MAAAAWEDWLCVVAGGLMTPAVTFRPVSKTSAV